jgi:hypothetical protein
MNPEPAMAAHAIFVTTEPALLALLHRHIEHLPDNANVTLELDSGERIDGIVAARPSLQVFRNKGGDEGTNGVVTLEDRARPGVRHKIWLSDIRLIHHEDSTLGSGF